MKSSELRKLAEAAAAQGSEPAVWDAIASRCDAAAEQLHYWDMVHVLQAFTVARVENRPLFLRLGEALSAKASHLAPKHVVDLFSVYEAHSLRPRWLYVELFHALVRLARSMYAEELCHTLQALARHQLGSPSVLAHLTRAVLRQLPDFRLRYLCNVAGALTALRACQRPLLESLNQRAELEVQSVAIQELLEDLQSFPLLEYSWAPYEELCLEELKARVGALRSSGDVGQFARPFEALALLQARGLLCDSFLEALCQWCLETVHRPNTRSERRPTAWQLALLHDHCRERGLERAPALQDALQYYVESGGGQWPRELPQPLRYRRKRRYVRVPDPLKGRIAEAADSDPLFGVQAVDPLLGDTAAVTPTKAAPLRPKPSGPAASLEEGATTTSVRIGSRKGPRPRIKLNPRLLRTFWKSFGKPPRSLWGGWHMLPKYKSGLDNGAPPWKQKVWIHGR